MSYTKANLADVAASQQAATEAGSAATESAQRASDVSAQMESGVDEITAALEGHFRQLADALRGHARATKAQLGATDWEGRSRESAVAAEEALNSRVDTTMASAEEGTAAFKQTMLAQANDFVGVVQTDFRTILANIDAAYVDLAAAQSTFAENLQLADDTIQFG